MNPTLKKQLKSTLIQTLLDLNTTNELESFTNDFFTDSELNVFIKRLACAYWLKKGRTYKNIRENIKVSSATIATVQSNLEKSGMQLALAKIEAEEWANQWSEKIKKFVGK